tara:strand:+ start:328 stop:471 length:144 start_codon:yes stop_codon:yes gene_type:complete
MGKEVERWLDEPEQNTFMTEINALQDADREIVMEFIRALLRKRKPTE